MLTADVTQCLVCKDWLPLLKLTSVCDFVNKRLHVDGVVIVLRLILCLLFTSKLHHIFTMCLVTVTLYQNRQ